MTPEEFVIWLRGFAQAANEYNVTPKQWQDVKDKLDTVQVEEYDIMEETEINEYGFIEGVDWDVTITSGSFDIKYYTHT
jgi:hypothetical protein